LGALQGHTGNIRLHKVVAAYKLRYTEARRHEKTEIAEEIVRLIKTAMGPNTRPGRFLKRVESEDCWVEVSDTVARDKVSHALRGKLRREGRANETALVAARTTAAGSGSTRGGVGGGDKNASSNVGASTISSYDEDGEASAKRMDAVGGGQNFLGMPAHMIPGSNLMMQQQMQQQHLFASALAEHRQLAAGMAGHAFGGMGFYGGSGPTFASKQGPFQLVPSAGGSGGVDPLFLQQFAAERRMLGDSRFWM
jgi:hypothetical protein